MTGLSNHINQRSKCLRALATDSSGKLDVLRHDGDSLGVDGSQVGILEKTDKVGLSSLLKSQDGRSLESQVSLEILGNFSDKSLERKLSDQELSRLLVSSDLTKSDGTRSVSVRLLDTTGGRSGLSGSLGSQLLSWSLTSSGLTCGLLSTGHFFLLFVRINEDSSVTQLLLATIISIFKVAHGRRW